MRTISVFCCVLVSLFCFVLVHPFTVLAWHDKPAAQQFGVNNEIGEYLHTATSGGPLFATMVIVCHTRPHCPPQEQSAFLQFYRTREARDQGVGPGHGDYLGTGQFRVKEDGESLGKIIDFTFPDGTKWVRRSEGQEI